MSETDNEKTVVIDGLRLVIGVHKERLALWVRTTNPLKDIRLENCSFEMLTLMDRGTDAEGSYAVFMVNNPADGPATEMHIHNDDTGEQQ